MSYDRDLCSRHRLFQRCIRRQGLGEISLGIYDINETVLGISGGDAGHERSLRRSCRTFPNRLEPLPKLMLPIPAKVFQWERPPPLTGGAARVESVSSKTCSRLAPDRNDGFADIVPKKQIQNPRDGNDPLVPESELGLRRH